MSELFPLFLKLERRQVVVVGAGTVAARKIAELRNAGARVRVVAQVAAEEIVVQASRGELELCVRAFAPADLDGSWLVVAATNDAAVNADVAAAAEARHIFVNAVDDPPNASAYFGAIIRRAPFLVAISSSGQLPGLSRLLREVIERALPAERYVAAARALRKKWRVEGTDVGSRFGELLRELRDLGD